MGNFITDSITWLAKALGFYAPPPDKKRVKKDKPVPTLGSAQKKRADKRLKNLSKEEREKFTKLTDAAKSPVEKDQLTKALACNYSIEDIEKFAKKINGKDDKWIQNNLKLTGSTDGKGVKQQWSHSCNATTVQAIRGQLDPIYALKLHEENTDITDADGQDATKKNAKLAAEQKTMLTSEYDGKASGKHSGKAVARDKKGGSGRWADDLMNDLSDVTGVKYENKQVGDKYSVADAMKDVEKGAKVGHPVPIVIGNGVGQFTHYVLVTGLDKGPPKSWVIHDPWDGITVKRDVKDVKAGKINLANSNQITALDVATSK